MQLCQRKATVFAGIFTLIQGCIWAYIAVLSVGIYSCTFSYPYLTVGKNTIGNLFFYSYLLGSCQLAPGSGLEHMLRPPHRTYAFMLTYGIMSAVWIPSSILLLIIAVNNIHGKTAVRCFYPWMLSTGALLLLDIVGTIFYSIDIAHTLALKDYLETFPYVPGELIRGMEGLTVIPAVLMVVLFTRAVIVWIVNFILFFVMVQEIRSLRRPVPTAEFVEKEARIKPVGNMASSNWVRMASRPATPERRIEPGERRRVVLPDQIIDELRPRVEERRRMEADRNVIQSPTEERERPSLKPLVLRPPSEAPPPPPPLSSTPCYDVYGNPTTPESPQPVFVRANAANLNLRTEGGVNRDVPWSYVNPPKLPPLPKPLPEPDYTLHPVRRSNISTPSDDGEYKPLPKRYENNPNAWKVLP